jgi:hypothetical protein
MIEVEFDAPEKEFQELSRMLGIILQKDLAKEEKRKANKAAYRTRVRAGSCRRLLSVLMSQPTCLSPYPIVKTKMGAKQKSGTGFPTR